MINLTDNELKFLKEEIGVSDEELNDYNEVLIIIMCVEAEKGFDKDYMPIHPFYDKAQTVYYGISDRYNYYNGEIRDTDYYDQYLRKNGDIT